MTNGWNDFERSVTMLDEMRRRMDQFWDEVDGTRRATSMGTSWPRVNLFDRGDTLLVVAEVPGLAEDGIALNVHNDLLTIEGDRRTRAPEGYIAHRQERESLRFARAIGLPCKVDVEHTRAAVKDGVLTVTLPKAAEARPRQIAVKSE